MRFFWYLIPGYFQQVKGAAWRTPHFFYLPYWEKFDMRLNFMENTSTWVIFASEKFPCNFLQRAWSCKLKSLAARLWELTHPSSSSFEGSFPNVATNWGKHPRGPVLWIQKFLAPWSYNSWGNKNREKWEFYLTYIIEKLANIYK